MNGVLFLNRTFKCFRGISKYHHLGFTSVPGVIFVRVSPTAEEERISLIKPNVDLKYLLTNMPNIFNSGEKVIFSYTNMYGRSAVISLKPVN